MTMGFDDITLSYFESTPTKIRPIFGQLGGHLGQEMANETAQHKHFKPPSNETLSHLNGKVVFDHRPNKTLETQ